MLNFPGSAVEFFAVLLIFSIFSSFIICFLSSISYPQVTVLYLESFENNLFELDFSITKKRVSTVKPSREGEFFLHGYAIFFSRFFSPFHTLKNF